MNIQAHHPEAGPNVFEEKEKPAEEKTTELPGAQREEDVPIAYSPDSNLVETTADVAEDTRAPLGRDAGAPEATMADAVGGGAGWQGGAEDGPGLPPVEVEDEATAHIKLPMPEMQLDEDSEDLVEQALKMDREDAIREMEGL